MASQPTAVKLHFVPTGEIRRVPIDICQHYDKLVFGFMTSIFGEHPDFTLQYEDDEGDVITITSDEELQAALQVAGDMSLKCLKLNVFPTKDSALTHTKNTSKTEPQSRANRCQWKKTCGAGRRRKCSGPTMRGTNGVNGSPLSELMGILSSLQQQAPADAAHPTACGEGTTSSPHPLAHILGGIAQGLAATSETFLNEMPPVHFGVTCDRSGMSPIIGTRFHLEGADYDLCEAEFEKLPELERLMFVKIERPGAEGIPFTQSGQSSTDAKMNDEPLSAGTRCASEASEGPRADHEQPRAQPGRFKKADGQVVSGSNETQVPPEETKETAEKRGGCSSSKNTTKVTSKASRVDPSPTTTTNDISGGDIKYSDELAQLCQMGFTDRDMNMALLERYQGRLQRVINALFDLSDVP